MSQGQRSYKDPKQRQVGSQQRQVASYLPRITKLVLQCMYCCTYYLQRDERDIAFAQAYLATAKEELKGDRRKYEALLGLLNQFGKSNSHPVEVRL